MQIVEDRPGLPTVNGAQHTQIGADIDVGEMSVQAVAVIVVRKTCPRWLGPTPLNPPMTA
jgi:hypothetical protein